MHWFLDPIQNHYFDFEGRTTRKQFWMFQLMYVIVAVIIAVIDGVLQLGFLGPLLSLALLLPNLGIAARRLHDIGKSGWWQLIGLIPVIGWIIMIVWLVTDSGPDNEYGPNPKGGADMATANMAPETEPAAAPDMAADTAQSAPAADEGERASQ